MKKDVCYVEETEVEKETLETKTDQASKKRFPLPNIIIIALAVALVFVSVISTAIIKTLEIQLDKTREELAEALRKKPEVQITSVSVRDRIREIGELSTQVYEYDNFRTVEDFRKFFGTDFNIPGTKNSVTIYYSGTVKMGYNLSDIETVVDNTKKVITIDLPEATATENSIHLTKIDSKNNILNPIDIEDLIKYLDGYKDEALENAMYNGITEKANARMEFIIRNSLSIFPDYTVEFI